MAALPESTLPYEQYAEQAQAAISSREGAISGIIGEQQTKANRALLFSQKIKRVNTQARGGSARKILSKAGQRMMEGGVMGSEITAYNTELESMTSTANKQLTDIDVREYNEALANAPSLSGQTDAYYTKYGSAIGRDPSRFEAIKNTILSKSGYQERYEAGDPSADYIDRDRSRTYLVDTGERINGQIVYSGGGQNWVGKPFVDYTDSKSGSSDRLNGVWASGDKLYSYVPYNNSQGYRKLKVEEIGTVNSRETVSTNKAIETWSPRKNIPGFQYKYDIPDSPNFKTEYASRYPSVANKMGVTYAGERLSTSTSGAATKYNTRDPSRLNRAELIRSGQAAPTFNEYSNLTASQRSSVPDRFKPYMRAASVINNPYTGVQRISGAGQTLFTSIPKIQTQAQREIDLYQTQKYNNLGISNVVKIGDKYVPFTQVKQFKGRSSVDIINLAKYGTYDDRGYDVEQAISKKEGKYTTADIANALISPNYGAGKGFKDLGTQAWMESIRMGNKNLTSEKAYVAKQEAAKKIQIQTPGKISNKDKVNNLMTDYFAVTNFGKKSKTTTVNDILSKNTPSASGGVSATIIVKNQLEIDAEKKHKMIEERTAKQIQVEFNNRARRIDTSLSEEAFQAEVKKINDELSVKYTKTVEQEFKKTTIGKKYYENIKLSNKLSSMYSDIKSKEDYIKTNEKKWFGKDIPDWVEDPIYGKNISDYKKRIPDLVENYNLMALGLAYTPKEKEAAKLRGIEARNIEQTKEMIRNNDTIMPDIIQDWRTRKDKNVYSIVGLKNTLGRQESAYYDKYYGLPEAIEQQKLRTDKLKTKPVSGMMSAYKGSSDKSIQERDYESKLQKIKGKYKLWDLNAKIEVSRTLRQLYDDAPEAMVGLSEGVYKTGAFVGSNLALGTYKTTVYTGLRKYDTKKVEKRLKPQGEALGRLGVLAAQTYYTGKGITSITTRGTIGLGNYFGFAASGTKAFSFTNRALSTAGKTSMSIAGIAGTSLVMTKTGIGKAYISQTEKQAQIIAKPLVTLFTDRPEKQEIGSSYFSKIALIGVAPGYASAKMDLFNKEQSTGSKILNLGLGGAFAVATPQMSYLGYKQLNAYQLKNINSLGKVKTVYNTAKWGTRGVGLGLGSALILSDYMRVSNAIKPEDQKQLEKESVRNFAQMYIGGSVMSNVGSEIGASALLQKQRFLSANRAAFGLQVDLKNSGSYVTGYTKKQMVKELSNEPNLLKKIENRINVFLETLGNTDVKPLTREKIKGIKRLPGERKYNFWKEYNKKISEQQLKAEKEATKAISYSLKKGYIKETTPITEMMIPSRMLRHKGAKATPTWLKSDNKISLTREPRYDITTKGSEEIKSQILAQQFEEKITDLYFSGRFDQKQDMKGLFNKQTDKITKELIYRDIKNTQAGKDMFSKGMTKQQILSKYKREAANVLSNIKIKYLQSLQQVPFGSATEALTQANKFNVRSPGDVDVGTTLTTRQVESRFNSIKGIYKKELDYYGIKLTSKIENPIDINTNVLLPGMKQQGNYLSMHRIDIPIGMMELTKHGASSTFMDKLFPSGMYKRTKEGIIVVDPAITLKSYQQGVGTISRTKDLAKIYNKLVSDYKFKVATAKTGVEREAIFKEYEALKAEAKPSIESRKRLYKGYNKIYSIDKGDYTELMTSLKMPALKTDYTKNKLVYSNVGRTKIREPVSLTQSIIRADAVSREIGKYKTERLYAARDRLYIKGKTKLQDLSYNLKTFTKPRKETMNRMLSSKKA
jgi:hypothetical protein